MSRFLFCVLFLASAGSQALTTVQSSTTFGYYLDYFQSPHYPVYQSLSLHGFYENGNESGVELYANNDFAANSWLLIPTQIQYNIPWGPRWGLQAEKQSKIKIGRQLFMEGFDFSLLDGVEVPYYINEDFGFMPVAGFLNSPDPGQTNNPNTPIMGLFAWERVFGAQLREGYSSREIDNSVQYVYGSFQYQFERLPWAPVLMAKEELNAIGMSFNQGLTDLVLNFSDNLTGRISYAELNPRPTNHTDNTLFVYRLFALSPTQIVSANINWVPTERQSYNLGVEGGYYSTGTLQQYTDRQDFSADFQIHQGQSVSPTLIHINNYGGELYDLGLRYVFERSSLSQYRLEGDLAYLSKINHIAGWIEHLRGGFETQFWQRAKVLFVLEGERNQYFVFDMRAMAYVTNYL